MIKTSIEKISDQIGFDIGLSDNQTQAKLLNGLCKGLKSSMDHNILGKQLCYIVDDLNNDSMIIIKEICEYIKLKESELK